jgi:hypothetical protein
MAKHCTNEGCSYTFAHTIEWCGYPEAKPVVYPEAVFEVYVNGENLYQAHGDADLGRILEKIGSDISAYWHEGQRQLIIEIEAHE